MKRGFLNSEVIRCTHRSYGSFFVVSSHMTYDGLNRPCKPWPWVSAASDRSRSWISVQALRMEQNNGRVMFDWQTLCEEVDWLYDYVPIRVWEPLFCGSQRQPIHVIMELVQIYGSLNQNMNAAFCGILCTIENIPIWPRNVRHLHLFGCTNLSFPFGIAVLH